MVEDEEEEEEWRSRGLGLGDALRQLAALTEERDAAVQSEDLLLAAQARLEAEMERCARMEAELAHAREAVRSYEGRLAASANGDVEDRRTDAAQIANGGQDHSTTIASQQISTATEGHRAGPAMKRRLHRLSSAIRRKRPRCSGSTVLVFLSICFIFSYDAMRLGLRLSDVSSIAKEMETLAFGPVVDQQHTRVLITRTVSPSEIPIVVDDAMYVKSFYSGQHEALLQRSRQYCNVLREAGYAAKMDPLINGTQTFPNHILCNYDEASMENHYLGVHVDFMLFARSDENVQQIAATIEAETYKLSGSSLYEVKVDIRDVSINPKKIWNWMLHCDEERLAGYDYIWFIDGDISLQSLNWQAFWQQVKLLRPKITQASAIGDGTKDQYGSTHTILRYPKDADSRLIAGDVPMIEVQSPLLETKTWLDYRKAVMSRPRPMELIEQGAETCFDMLWCHLAANNLTGSQTEGRIPLPIRYRESSPAISLDDKSNANIKGRGCVVLYATPIVHITHHTINTAGNFVQISHLLCKYLRLEMGAIGKKGLGFIYEQFGAPPNPKI